MAFNGGGETFLQLVFGGYLVCQVRMVSTDSD